MNMNMGTPSTSSNTSQMAMGPSQGGMSERGCKISMLFNWYTIDTCFFSSNWKITSQAMFAGSVLGVVALTLIVEALRRLTKEYDKRLLVQFRQKAMLSTPPLPASIRATSHESTRSKDSCASDKTLVMTDSRGTLQRSQSHQRRVRRAFRPSLVQQLVRTVLHTLQFALAYMIMLLAMYYNGFVLLGIVIGTAIGFFAFSWESVTVDEEDEVTPISCH